MAIGGNQTLQHALLSGLITAGQYIILLEYASVVGALLSLTGVISNIIIIKTFIAMGVNDGVTVSFLSLAIFDLAYLIGGVSLSVSVLCYAAELKSTKRFPIEPYGVSIYFTNVMILINVTNVLTTTFLAVARTLCVARPLQFKNTFSRTRAVYFMFAFALFSIAIYMPMFVNMGMSQKFDKLTNTSRPSWWRSGNREAVKEIVWVLTDTVLPVTTKFIIIICVVIMANCLRASSRFRQSSAATSEKTFDKLPKDQGPKPNVADSNSGNVGDKLSGKDLKVVQQVVLISVVYILCNIPKHLISVITVFEPEFSIGRRCMKLYMSTNGIRKHFEILNSAVNLIIYCKYNTKFRYVLFNTVQ